MNKKLGKLEVDKFADYKDKIIKALEEAGFVLVLESEASFEKHYIVAERSDKE